MDLNILQSTIILLLKTHKLVWKWAKNSLPPSGRYKKHLLSYIQLLLLAKEVPHLERFYSFSEHLPLHGGNLVAVEGLVCLKDENGYTSGKYFTYW